MTLLCLQPTTAAKLSRSETASNNVILLFHDLQIALIQKWLMIIISQPKWLWEHQFQQASPDNIYTVCPSDKNIHTYKTLQDSSNTNRHLFLASLKRTLSLPHLVGISLPGTITLQPCCSCHALHRLWKVQFDHFYYMISQLCTFTVLFNRLLWLFYVALCAMS